MEKPLAEARCLAGSLLVGCGQFGGPLKYITVTFVFSPGSQRANDMGGVQHAMRQHLPFPVACPLPSNPKEFRVASSGETKMGKVAACISDFSYFSGFGPALLVVGRQYDERVEGMVLEEDDRRIPCTPGEHENRCQMHVHPPQNGAIGYAP